MYRIRQKQRQRRENIKHWLFVCFLLSLLLGTLWGSWYLTKINETDLPTDQPKIEEVGQD